MGEKRKLQTEIEKTLRRVEEGISGFDNVLDKAQDAVTSPQKDKLEAELKREMKKLQRYRDQIKTWLSTADIKDKGPLEESRKAIEKEMEKYKTCEKLFKVKAFSKEGLAQLTKVVPQEAERERHRKWLREALDRFKTFIDFNEAELEKSKVAKSGKGKGDNYLKQALLERDVALHHWHVSRLEQVLRALENNTLNVTLLDRLKEYCFDVLNGKKPLDFISDASQLYKELLGVSIAPEPNVLLKLTKTSNKTDPAAEQGDKEKENMAEGDQLTASKSVDQGSPDPTACANAPCHDTPTLRPTSDNAVSKTTPGQERPVSPPQEDGVVLSVPPVAPAAAPSTSEAAPLVELASLEVSTLVRPDSGENNISQETLQQGPVTAQVASEDVAAQSRAGSPCKERTKGRVDLELMSMIIDAAYQTLPTMAQRQPVRYYQPRTLWPTPPPSFPSQPLKNHATREFFEKLDLDTLFFTFYYQQGTYQQFLAARRLKQLSWIFHKKYLTWFFPPPECKMVGDQFRRGTFAYFDSETGWSMRVKQDLVLDLADTENELQFSSVTPASSESDKKVVPSYARSPAVTCCKEYGDA